MVVRSCTRIVDGYEQVFMLQTLKPCTFQLNSLHLLLTLMMLKEHPIISLLHAAKLKQNCLSETK